MLFRSGGFLRLDALALQLLIGGGDYFIRGLPVNTVAVLEVEFVRSDDLFHSAILGRTYKALRRENVRALNHGGYAVCVKEADQRLTDAKLHQRLLGVEAFVRAERARRGAHGLLLGRGIGAQRVLHAV